ncbi:hypothetical protein JRQ81_007723 [Phrynocephalus forsythii]|uniref:Coiled-coil domain-containing protein 116 n=1 Tax=Phrynocephalus forsythii TaxID=171643 RepID=A0A9Q1ATM8_9SAUR|nr:hypothetical protein JRQ81_007723 [Phrynocephalus forsythii]
MERHRYSGYLADDESLRGAQMGYFSGSHRRGCDAWRRTPRPPSRCQFRRPEAATSSSTSPTFPSMNRGKRKHRRSTTGSTRESSHLASEFSEFVDFLADEDVLESLQGIVEDAVQKLRNMTTEDGEPVFDIQDDSASSAGSTSWSFSYSSTQSRSKYSTTATPSSSEEERRRHAAKRKRQAHPEGRACLLEKYAARLPKLGKKTRDTVSGGFHAQTFSERSGDSYFFRREHFHIWAKLAESFEQFQPPKKDYFAKFRKEVPSQSFSVESLQKEITSVLKRPTPSSIPLYYPGQQPFDALDFLEENKILAALQGIINEAVLQVLEMRGVDGTPLLDLFDEEGHARMLWESSLTGSEEEEEDEEDEDEGDEEGDEGGGEGGDEGEESSGSGEETSEEDDSKSGGSKSSGKKKKKKKKQQKGKKKKKGKAESPAGDEKSKGKYTPPPLPKTRGKSLVADESQRKAKYVPPPLPKTKPRGAPEEPVAKPKYTPPPLPKPKPKKPDSVQGEAEAPKQVMLTKHIITPKDIKRAHLQARPLPKQSIIDFLIENAAKLILYKYNYETLLSEKLGFISVPVTKTLLEIMFGYKKVRGSGIRLSSQIDWSKVYDEIYAPRPPKPKPPKLKAGSKKKAKDKKQRGQVFCKAKKEEEKRSVLLKANVPKGKVVVIKAPVDQEVESVKAGVKSMTEVEDTQETEIFEIIPPQFPEEGEMDEASADEEFEDSVAQPPQATPKASVTSTTLNSPQRSVVPEESPTKLAGAPVGAEVSSPALSLKKSLSSRRASGPSDGDSDRGSRTFLPEVEPAGHPSEELLRKASSSRKASWDGDGSKTVLPKISN